MQKRSRVSTSRWSLKLNIHRKYMKILLNNPLMKKSKNKRLLKSRRRFHYSNIILQETE